MLPFSWRGRVALPLAAGDDPEQILDRFTAALAEQRAREVRRESGAVTFWAGALFRLVPSWNLLGPITWGRLDVERGPEGIEVRYHITFTELVTFVTCGVVFMTVTFFRMTGPEMWEVRYVFPVVAWAWLVGGNIATTLGRFPAFVRRWGIGEDTGARA
jgi:hypothetical protein